VRLGLLADWLERLGPNFDDWIFWSGGAIAVVGATATAYHWRYPGVSITNGLANAAASCIRWLHSLSPWPVADLATYLGVVLLLVGLFFKLVKRMNRRGGTKT